jgi:hypothetical protein
MKVIELVLMAVLGATGALPAFASEVHQFAIPEEEAAAAIRDFGTQAHVQILVAGEAVSGKKLHAVTGELSTEDGLKTLLSGSGLTHQYVGDHSVAVMPAQLPRPGSSTQAREVSGGTDSADKEGKKSFFDRFRLAQVDQGKAASNKSVGTQDEEQASQRKPVQLEEVLVTAQKRIERLQDVPVPVSVLTADALAETNKLLLTDYATSVPGFNVAPLDFASQVMAIRGVTTGGFTLPTVAITVDGVCEARRGHSLGLIAWAG